MNFDAPEEHGLLRDAVRQFFERELPETRIREMDRARRIPRELWRRLAELGWVGLAVPEAYGGSGGDLTAGVVLCEELAKRFPSLAVDWVLISMTARAFLEHGTEEQKAEYLPRLAKGEFLMSFGMTEPGGGTDILGLTTRAEMAGNEWRISGQKLFTSLADDADAILVLCRTDPAPEDKRARGLSLILTPRQQPAVTVRRLELMAMRAACTCEVFLDGASAPADAVLGERGRGWYHLLSSLDEERTLAAAIYVGITQAALDLTVRYAQEREAYGRPIGAFQAVQHPLAEVATELEQIRLLTDKAAWLQANGRDCAGEAAMAKLAASEVAIRATDRCMRILAGYGLVEESAMERLFRDARLGPFSPISNEMVKNFLGERLGLPRSY
ncbi:MAG: acyl-CoA dehydrogenase family protein [Alphaproteobacteria bacterium]|jgi:acyl-CoA dehydrogenase|nr:acyl-CoA dehydrogenase family protein [Alphaproteobacteria bacterium]MDP6564099.1 acyl-CoA dehydrogenase family protein [Alphaproteobacteria bacterium]MDP6816269.1 acyl-CoA dehydrogenase family protein [Alphaproteobacteria bacterium]